MRNDSWNKCDECGKFIPYADLEAGKALRVLLEPSSFFGEESWVTLCRKHNNAGAKK